MAKTAEKRELPRYVNKQDVADALGVEPGSSASSM